MFASLRKRLVEIEMDIADGNMSQYFKRFN